MGDDTIDAEIQSDDEKENEDMPVAIEIPEENAVEGSDSDDEEEDDDGEDAGEADDADDSVSDTAGDAERLECDNSAYIFNLQLKAGSPCLSFDILKDDLGDKRADNFPLMMTIVAGTQDDRKHFNNVLVMKLSNMKPSKDNAKKGDDEEEDDEESDSDDEDEKPELEVAKIRHTGCVNRIKATNIGGTNIAASWSESGRVLIWDLSLALQAVHNHHAMSSYIQNHSTPSPMFSFNTNNVEGYGLAWSPLVPGMLATGDCEKHIHLWKPMEAGTWHVDQRSFKGHTASVEDIQWSPNESNVMATCSCDKTIRIWDTRANPARACMLTKNDAHDSDVNVISWNPFDPLILSGGDDGQLKIWDLRTFPTAPPVCTFKHHTAPITSVEWHPTDSTVFAASGSDNQITQWDLSLERDTDMEQNMGLAQEDTSYPPQLLFIHKGQTDIKELHWHSQMPGVLISTAVCGFNVFRTISV